jgi:hypothetical protein
MSICRTYLNFDLGLNRMLNRKQKLKYIAFFLTLLCLIEPIELADTSTTITKVADEASTVATVPGGATNTATVPGGATNTATVPGGATNTATVPGGATNTATVPGGATNTATVPGTTTTTAVSPTNEYNQVKKDIFDLRVAAIIIGIFTGLTFFGLIFGLIILYRKIPKLMSF